MEAPSGTVKTSAMEKQLKKNQVAKVGATSDLGKLKLVMIAGVSWESGKLLEPLLLALSIFSEPSLWAPDLLRMDVFVRAERLRAEPAQCPSPYRERCLGCFLHAPGFSHIPHSCLPLAE